MNSAIDRSQYQESLIHRSFTTILYSSHNFSKCSKNSMILCSLKYNIFKDFKASMNIIYLTAKDVAIEEKKIEIVIFKNLMNENILKLFDSEIIIILMKIV